MKEKTKLGFALGVLAFCAIVIILLTAPGHSAIVSLDSAHVSSMDGALHVSTYGSVLGNRTCASGGSLGGCDANFTMWFDLTNYSSLTINNFRIKHAFQIPSGGVGWTATGLNYTIPSITGVYYMSDFLGFNQAAITNTSCLATNATGGTLRTPQDLLNNNSYTDFNCSLPVDKKYLVVTWAGNYTGYNANLVTDNKGTTAFGRNWAIMEFDGANVTGSNLTTYAYDWGLTLNHTVLHARYTFLGCGSSPTNYACHIGVALPNGTVVTTTNWTFAYEWNWTCSVSSPINSLTHELPENPAEPQLPLGLYQVLTVCYQDNNISLATTSPSVWIDTNVNWTPPTTTTAAPGLTGMAFTQASNEAVAYWTPWIASNGPMLFGFFIAIVVLIVFMVLSVEFNTPILATVGVVLFVFIGVVTFLLTNAYGLLLLIVIILLLLIIGAITIFKGFSA